MATVGEYGAILTLKDNFSGTADKAAKKVGVFGKLGSAAGVGLGLVAAGVAAAGTAAAVSLKGFSDFESAMLDLKAIASDDLQFGDYEKMYDQAKQLGAATQYSAKEVALGMKELAAAGLKPQQVMDSISGTLSMAAAGEIEVARAAEIAANTLTQFNLQANETGRVADVMAKGANLGTLGMEEMAESLKYVGPIAGGMVNQSLEEVSAALVSLSNNGIKGSQAGTVLRGTLARLAAPSKNTAAALEKLNIQTLDAAGNMKPLSEIVGQFSVATQGMGDAQKTAYAKMLVGETAMSGFLALAKDGEEVIKGYRGELENANGAAEAMAKIKMSGLAGAWELMTGAIDGVVISLGERLAPLLVNITDKVGKLADKANGLFALGDALKYLSPDTSNLSKMLAPPQKRKPDATGSQILAAGKMAVDKVDIAQNLQVPGGTAVTKEQIEGVYNAYSKFNNLTGLNLDVSQFMNLSQKLGEVKEAFSELWATISDGFTSAVQPLMQAFGVEGTSNLDLLTAGLDGLKTVFDGIAGVAGFLLPIARTLIEVIVAIAEPIIAIVKPAFDNLMSTIQNSSPLWSFLGSVLKGVGRILGAVLGVAIKLVIDHVNNLIGGANWLIETILGIVAPGKTAEEVFNKIGSAIKKVIDFAADLIGKIGKIDFSKIKIPSLGGLFGGEKKFSGASYIMKDEQPALLHRGEAVLTRDENKRFRNMNAETNIPSLGSNFNVQSNKGSTKGKTVVFSGNIQLNTPLTDKASIEKAVSEFIMRVSTRLDSEGR
jgi:TP901 family phage tail tape measure protein